MSFSSEIKNKLCSQPLSCPACAAAEAAGMLCTGGMISTGAIRFTTENSDVSDRLHSDMEEAFGINIEFSSGTKNHSMIIDNMFETENIIYRLTGDVTPLECCENSYIRGAFLGCGSVSDPNSGYHLEFASKNRSEAVFLQKLLNKKGFGAKETSRKNYTVIYLKGYEQIADLLGLLGGMSGAFELFDIQIEKDMRNSINRRVNCENANANKAAKASSVHLHAINKIKALKKWESLPDTLKEIGELRSEFPEESLKELGEHCDPPIGKSGVNHRLNRIKAFADNL